MGGGASKKSNTKADGVKPPAPASAPEAPKDAVAKSSVVAAGPGSPTKSTSPAQFADDHDPTITLRSD